MIELWNIGIRNDLLSRTPIRLKGQDVWPCALLDVKHHFLIRCPVVDVNFEDRLRSRRHEETGRCHMSAKRARKLRTRRSDRVRLGAILFVGFFPITCLLESKDRVLRRIFGYPGSEINQRLGTASETRLVALDSAQEAAISRPAARCHRESLRYQVSCSRVLATVACHIELSILVYLRRPSREKSTVLGHTQDCTYLNSTSLPPASAEVEHDHDHGFAIPSTAYA